MSPIPYRTRSATKRARSPSSPTHYDRPAVRHLGVHQLLALTCPDAYWYSQKRAASGYDTSVSIPPMPLPSVSRSRSEDWVAQTRGLRLESPTLVCSGFNTPVSQPEGVRIDEEMVYEPMVCLFPDTSAFGLSSRAESSQRTDDLSMPMLQTMSASPQIPQSQYLCPPENQYTPSTTPPQYPSPSLLEIPLIQIQNATPSPVQPFPQASFERTPSSPQPSDHLYRASDQAPAASAYASQREDAQGFQYLSSTAPRKMRFTMGPRADCELCRNRVKGHYMHFD